MSEEVRNKLAISDFPGLNLESDEFNIQDGSSHDQVNVTSEDVGSLRSRRGARKILFEDD